jgi:hypothetical protein
VFKTWLEESDIGFPCIFYSHLKNWVAGIEKKCNFAAANGSVAQLDRATAF